MPQAVTWTMRQRKDYDRGVTVTTTSLVVDMIDMTDEQGRIVAEMVRRLEREKERLGSWRPKLPPAPADPLPDAQREFNPPAPDFNVDNPWKEPDTSRVPGSRDLIFEDDK